MNLDNELIEGLKKHDDKAYLTLFDHVYSPLHELAFMYVLDYDTANDIVQDTFINLYENSFLLDKVHNLEGYLRIAVRNRCYNYLRDLALEDQRKKLYWEEFLESETDNFDKAEFEIILKKIQEVMDVLPDRCGIICRMRFFEGKKIKEIANELFISEGTVKIQLHRGLEKIKDSIRYSDNFVWKEKISNIILFSFIL